MVLATLRLLFVFLLVVPLARAGNVALVLSESTGPYAEFSATLRDALDGSNWKLSRYPVGLDAAEDGTERADLIIAAGSTALRQVLGRGGSTPIIATLIPRQVYDKLVAESGSRNRRLTAIYLDQPPARQASFLRQLLPGKNRIGMLISAETRPQNNQFQHAFNAAGLILDSEESDTDRTLLPALSTLLSRVHVLLATPDTNIYKRDNIKAILVTTYRHQRPVVAFSAALVNAGALAALYSTPAQIARQSAELVLAFTNTLPAPMPPSQFAVQINQNVAQALNLNLPDEADIRRAMLADKDAR
ncbi:ABC transporter substrate-binding protein [Quatrionicoccus australiensis]|uniref:ABC transporter substrate-binding protein n=1 Tax=Quatrionicoccus australiensis TaxID=138118 RepID=UPI001CFA7D2B|nr:ABC transporter substrate binding protein [Quatrionicoccus australiensis]